MGGPKRLHRTASASRVKRLQYKPLHNLYLFRCWIWYLRDQVRQREGPLRARWNWRGTLSNWDTNATGLRNITPFRGWLAQPRSEEHTSELQSPCNLVCRLLLEKKKKKKKIIYNQS